MEQNNNVEFKLLIEQALYLQKQIKEITTEVVAPKENLLKRYKEKLLDEFKGQGLKKVQGEIGDVLFVEKRSSVKYDLEAIKSDLGLTDLSKYELKSPSINYLQIKLNK